MKVFRRSRSCSVARVGIRHGSFHSFALAVLAGGPEKSEKSEAGAKRPTLAWRWAP